jgi:lipopolysaccharide exporter
MTEKYFEKDLELQEKEDDAALAGRTVKSGMWVFALKTVQRGLGLVRTVILARLLAPSDFGIMGVAILAINAIETFSKTGFEQALIQKKQNTAEYLDTAWTIQLIRSVVLFCVLYITAPLVASFFKTPEALRIVRALAFIELLTGAKNIGVIYFQKDLRFDKSFFLEFSGLITNITVSLILAFTLKNVWALVFGSLSGALVTCVVSYALHPYKPNLKLDIPRAKDLFSFGKWLFGSSIILFLVTQGDDAFVGRILGITALGFYQMAYHLSNAPATEITHMISRVMFPAYSKIQENLPRMRRAYWEVLDLNMFLIMPVSACIFIFAEDFTFLFLGEKWLPIVGALKILAIAGFLRSLAATTGPVFYARGIPRVETMWQGVRLGVLAATIVPLAAKWGIYGASVAVCLSAGIAAAGFVIVVSREIGLRGRGFLKAMAFPALNVTLMLIVITIVRRHFDGLSFVAFIFTLIAAVLTYLMGTFLCEKYTSYKMLNTISNRLKGV